MRTDLLKIFVVASQEGSFAKAARKLSTDPSQISRSISLLETSLEVRLFQRTTRKITLTEAGTYYLGRVTPILDELEQAREEVSNINSEPRGTLRLTASVSYGYTRLMPLLKEFQAAYPDITLELILKDDNLDLVAENIDLAIRMAPSIDENVICSRLHETSYKVVASPHYIAASAPIRTPSDLEQHKTILFDLPKYRSNWKFKDATGAVSAITPKGSMIISNAISIQECVRNAMGIALLSDWQLKQDLKEKRCIDLFPNHKVTATTFDTAAWFLYPSRNFLPTKVRVTIDFLRARLQNPTAAEELLIRQ